MIHHRQPGSVKWTNRRPCSILSSIKVVFVFCSVCAWGTLALTLEGFRRRTGQGPQGFILSYERVSFAPMLVWRTKSPPFRKQALMKMSCRALATSNSNSSSKSSEYVLRRIFDKGHGKNRAPVRDTAWTEMAVTAALRMTNSSVSRLTFGLGKRIGPFEADMYFSNCQESSHPTCLTSWAQVPSQCLWTSTGPMGYFERFLGIEPAQLTKRIYDSLKNDSQSLETLATLWIADAIIQKVDRRSNTNMFRLHKQGSFVPLDLEGLWVGDLNIGETYQLTRSPLILRESGLQVSDTPQLVATALNFVESMCGYEEQCRSLQVKLEGVLAQDDLMHGLEEAVTTLSQRGEVILCPYTSKYAASTAPFYGKVPVPANPKVWYKTPWFLPCCEGTNWVPAARYICRVLQQEIAPELIHGDTTPAGLVAKIVRARVRTIRDALRKVMEKIP